IRMKIWSKVCGAVVCELAFVAAVSAHEHDFEFRRHYEMFGEELFVAGYLVGSFWSAGAPDNPLAVLRVPGATVVTKFVGKTTLLRPIDIHVVDFEIAVASRRKDDLLAVA